MNYRLIPTVQHYVYGKDSKPLVIATVRHAIDDICNLCQTDSMPKIYMRTTA